MKYKELIERARWTIEDLKTYGNDELWDSMIHDHRLLADALESCVKEIEEAGEMLRAVEFGYCDSVDDLPVFAEDLDWTCHFCGGQPQSALSGTEGKHKKDCSLAAWLKRNGGTNAD